MGCGSTNGSCTDTGLFTGKAYYYVVFDATSNVQSNQVELTPKPVSTASRANRYATLQTQLQSSLASSVATWNSPAPNQYFWTRDLVAMAYLELLFNPPSSANYTTALSQAQSFLTTVTNAQIATGSSPWLEGGYGHIPMQINVNPVVVGGTPAPGNIGDPNEDEFFAQSLVPMLQDFSPTIFSQNIQDWLAGQNAHAGLGLPAVITAMMYHSSNSANNPDAPLYSSSTTEIIDPSYTNMAITNSVELALLNAPGKPWANSQAYTQGQAGMTNWVSDMETEFIHEGGSPVYYDVDVQSLLLAYRYGPATMRAQANWGLNAFWSDIAASEFNSNQAFARAATRDYDFMRGLGEADGALFVEGLFSPPNSNPDYVPGMTLQQVLLYINGVDPNGYQPGADSLQYASIPTRSIAETYNTASPADVTTYITPDYSLGSMSANYNAQDKIVKLQLANTTYGGFANVTFEPGVMPTAISDPNASNPGDDPYDYVTTGKPQHIDSHPVIVQDEGAVLALLDLMPSDYNTNVRVATSFLFPSNATTLATLGEPGNVLNIVTEAAIQIPAVNPSDGHDLDLCQAAVSAGTASQKGVNLTLGEVFGLRNTTGCAALKIFTTDGAGGYTPTFSLVSDGTGQLDGYHAGRVIACHYSGSAPPATSTPLRLGFYMQAASCPNGDSDLQTLMTAVQQMNMTPQTSGSGSSETWSVTVTPVSSTDTLTAAQKISDGDIVTRQINGQNISAEGFTVNSTNVFQFLTANAP
jgi:hypothetical protein